MSMLSDYFAATPAELAELDVAAGPSGGGYDVASVGGIDPVVNLATLEEILTGTDATAIIADSADPVRSAHDEDGPWVYEVRSPLVAALYALPADDVPRFAEEWSRTEELAGSPPAELAKALTALADLARRGTDTARNVYCWLLA